MLVDSHCHLHLMDLAPYADSLDNAIEAARAQGVQRILCVSVTLSEAPTVKAIAEQYSGVHASVGCHPSEKCPVEPTVEALIALADHPKVIAIGETGLDYHYNSEGLDIMRARFRCHVRASKATGKPVIVHSRAAPEDTIDILTSEDAGSAGGIMHCFTESWDLAKAALDLGLYISFSGIVTFKNAVNVADVAKKVPLDRLLIETDAPYLTPVPFRGKPNAPEYVRFTAAKIAELKGVDFDTVAAQTTENYFDLFPQQE